MSEKSPSDILKGSPKPEDKIVYFDLSTGKALADSTTRETRDFIWDMARNETLTEVEKIIDKWDIRIRDKPLIEDWDAQTRLALSLIKEEIKNLKLLKSTNESQISSQEAGK